MRDGFSIKGYIKRIKCFIKVVLDNSFYLISLLTILKAIILYLFYQNVVYFGERVPTLVAGYGWKELVEALFRGEYKMICQSGLASYFDLTSSAYRPPLYPFFLYTIIFFWGHNAFVIILAQSIITTLVAYFSMKIVCFNSDNNLLRLITFVVIFFFPMNFMKSSTLDEAPLALLFMLMAIFYFLKAIYSTDNIVLFSLFAGIFFAFSVLTRFTMLFVVIGLVSFLALSRVNSKNIMLPTILMTFLVFLSPWLLRNYSIYGTPVLSVGSGRILLMTQSQEFIHNFPETSVDEIERDYLKKIYFSYPSLRGLPLFDLDKKFKSMAIDKIKTEPYIFYQSILAKLKIFYPRYYPDADYKLRSLVYLFSYSTVLVFFVFSFFSSLLLAQWPYELKIVFLSLLLSLLPAVIFFMLSRHMYIPLIMMLIYSFVYVKLLSFTATVQAYNVKNVLL